MSHVAVVGAGLGGLSAAIHLAAAGHRVTVLEGADQVGGKAGTVELPGGRSSVAVEADTGPSLLTLPHVFDDVFRAAGSSLEDEVDLIRLSPAFRYLWPDGTALDLHHDPRDSTDAVRDALGADAAEDFARFLEYAAGIWEVAAPHFVEGPAPSVGRLARHLRALPRIDPLRSMQGAIERRVRSPHLRDVLMRYATYNGSDPRRAPATLLCIAHVDLTLGGLGVRGGVAAVVRALARVARRLGVEIRCGSWVERVHAAAGRVQGVVVDGRVVRADAVVINADVAHLKDNLLPDRRTPGRGGAPSTSAWNGILRARRGAPRAPHTVLFPERYEDEFADLFDHDRPPRAPTVYLCAQSRAHARDGWEDHEAVFLMVNAPAEPEVGRRDPAVWRTVRETVEARLRAHGLWGDDDALVWSRTPADLAARFPGSRGALYGAASTARLAAFKRPPNRVRAWPGLYLASGTAHPGGGMPLCVLSGRAAARALVSDLGRGERGRSSRSPISSPRPAFQRWSGQR